MNNWKLIVVIFMFAKEGFGGRKGWNLDVK